MKKTLRSNNKQVTPLPIARMPENSNELEFYEILTPVYIALPSSSLRKPLPQEVTMNKTNPKMNMNLRSKPEKRVDRTRNLKASFNPIKQMKKVANKASEKAKQIKSKMELKKKSKSSNIKTLASASTGKMSTLKSTASKQKRQLLKSANPPNDLKKSRRPMKKRNLSSGYKRRILPLRKSQLRSLKPNQLKEASKQSSSVSKRSSIKTVNTLKNEKIADKQIMKSEDSKVALKSHIKKMDKVADSSTKVKKDVETIVTVEKHPGDENKIDIDLDTTVDPQTSKPIKVHTHAEVDKNKMEVYGKAEAKEAKGEAQIEGEIFHQGSKDNKIIKLEVVEDDYDSEDMSLEAKAEQESMSKKDD